MTHEIDLNGKVAIVTGAGQGNGLAIANTLKNAGALVVSIDKRFPGHVENQIELNHQLTVDLTNTNCLSLISNFLIKLNIKEVDILVNNAGITIPNELTSYCVKDWHKTIDINLTLPFRLTQKIVSNYMADNLSVINIASLASEFGFPNNPAYIASKGGLAALTKSLAFDLGEKKVRVNAISPGYIKTAMTEKSWNDQELRQARTDRSVMGRWGEPKDIANAVLFLASDLSSFITGQNIFVDGGWSIKGL